MGTKAKVEQLYSSVFRSVSFAESVRTEQDSSEENVAAAPAVHFCFYGFSPLSSGH
jgi:hypothetical protein